MLNALAALIGIASIIDGDTIEIHGQRVRFHGIDSPESRQLCQRDDKPWRCGQAAALALSDYVGKRTVTCDEMGRDRWKRVIARCYVDGVELNAWLVRQGWALDYPRYSKGEFADEQAEAEAAGRGIWASEFQPPWEWRRR